LLSEKISIKIVNGTRKILGLEEALAPQDE